MVLHAISTFLSPKLMMKIGINGIHDFPVFENSASQHDSLRNNEHNIYPEKKSCEDRASF